ncbi:MAG: YfbK domain-containing protein [Akkermansiaceae bacterium]
MNEDLTTFIEPELEARIVALVLGEASAFEQEELQRVIAQRPELQLFKARLEELHGMVGEAIKPPDEEEWKLSGERREKILAKIQEPSPVTEPAPGRRVSKVPRRLVYYGSAACFIAIVGGLSTPALLKEKKEQRAPMMLAYSTVESDEQWSGAEADFDLRPQKKSPPDYANMAANADIEASALLGGIESSYYDEGQLEQTVARESRTRFASELKRKSKSNGDLIAANSVPAPAGGGDDGFGYTGKKDGKGEVNTRDGGVASNLYAMRRTAEKERELESLTEVTDEKAADKTPAVAAEPSSATAMTRPAVVAAKPTPAPAPPVAPSAPVPNFKMVPEFDDRVAMGPKEEAPVMETESAVLESKVIELAETTLDDDFDIAEPEPAPDPGNGRAEGKGAVGLERLAKREKAASPAKAERPPAALASLDAVIPDENGLSNGQAKRGGQEWGRRSERDFTGSVAGGGIDGGIVPNSDFVDPPKVGDLPEVQEQIVSGIVTAGLRSGNEAVNRYSVDAILNDSASIPSVPGQSKSESWGAKLQSGGERDAAKLGKELSLAEVELSNGLPKKPGSRQPVEKNQNSVADARWEFEGQEVEESRKLTESNKKAPRGATNPAQPFPESKPTPDPKVAELADMPDDRFGPSDDPFGGGGGDFGDGDDFGSADPFGAPAADDSGVDGLVQQERLRRQQSVVEADALLAKGRQAYAEGDFETATAAYRNSLDKLPQGTVTEERRKVVNDHLKDSSLALSQNYRRTGRYNEARQLLTEVQKNNPGDESAAQGLEYLDDPIRTSPSLSYEFTKDVDKVRRGLYTGEGYHDLGLYEKAEAEFKKVLKVDPYNQTARQWFTRNAEAREELGQAGEDATRAELLAKVDEAWELSVPAAKEGEDGASKVREMRFALPLGFEDTLASSFDDSGEDVDSFGGTPDDDFGIDPNVGVEELLKYSGITFMEGAKATLDPATNTLVVRNTAENLQLVDQLVTMVSKQKERDDREKAAQLKKIEAFETPVATKSDSTFSLNVSDVSFKLAKSSLQKGQWPDASKVRPEEFVNALSYSDAAPTQAEKVACVIEQGSHPFMQQRNLMRVSMSTAALGRNASTPLRLTVLLDQSGSMERADRAESVRRAFALLSSQLNANDEITLVGFARTPRLLAERVKGHQSAKLAEIVSNPLTEGGTNLEAALSSGLQLARQQFVEGAQNRIILLTDGAANLGDALPENLAKQVSQMRDAGIAFDACGVGADGLNDDILTSLTKQGDGRYYFLDRPEDADDGFARQIAGALRPAAKNVKVQVIFNPERVSKFKLYGFEKHKLKKEDFRNDSVDAAEMAAEESGVALYHFEPMPEGRGDIGTVSVRFLDTTTNQMVERTWTIPYDADSASFSEASPTLRLAGVAGLFAEKLKGSPVGERVELKRLRQEIQTLKPTFQNQPRFQELQTMLQQAGQ